ncbi:SDR family NAD(P)-dependent oxidoreductase [Kribbella sp. NPDC051587]|uniref:SDR family NAD(P)-dependent oxidoreductase n=1 Tax=Kribbella sp. NPDC051587 TaxID=3364119 RepID=UPI0037B2BBB8
MNETPPWRPDINKVILISGASSGFGAAAARALAVAGHHVYAGIRDINGRNAAAASEATAYAADHQVSLRPIDLDVKSESSVRLAVRTVVHERDRLDVLVHNAGRLAGGPAEAFTPEQLADLYDSNVLGAQRLNRAVLPHMRSRRDGLLLWVSSSSTRGGTPPYLAPYFAAKAAADSLATSYALEISRFGVDTTVLVPGVYTHGTDLFAKSAKPADTRLLEIYEAVQPGLLEHVGERLADLTPDWADVADVSTAIVAIVDTPKGSRPFRVHVDPVDDGAEVVNMMADRVRAEFLRRVGLADLLGPVLD